MEKISEENRKVIAERIRESCAGLDEDLIPSIVNTFDEYKAEIESEFPGDEWSDLNGERI